MLTSEVLNKAADEIERRGLWQANKPGTSAGTCAALAIAAVEEDHLPASAALVDYLGGAIGTLTGTIARWNDAPDRTQAEVIEVLRAAAAIEQAREAQPAVVTA